MDSPSLQAAIRWGTPADCAASLAQFFAHHVSPDYISHSELQFGRAQAVGVWSEQLREQVEAQIAQALKPATESSYLKVLIAEQGGCLCAFGLVRFDQVHRFCILEDLVVSASVRGQKWGSAVLDWVVERSAALGMGRIFLESGIQNEAAHRFFKQHGFSTTSVTMARDLAPPAQR